MSHQYPCFVLVKLITERPIGASDRLQLCPNGPRSIRNDLSPLSVVLTNGVQWRIYHVEFTKPINQELLIDIDFCALNPRSAADIEAAFMLTKEGWVKSALGDYQTQKQALSRFFLGALLVSDTVLDVIRRELRRVSPDVRIETDQIRDVLTNEVIKRDVLDGDQAETAKRKVARSASKPLRQTAKDDKEKEQEPEKATAE